jgi:hypothetical protein
MLPDFIIVGAPKAGTTSLFHYIKEHENIFMSEPKEVNYFSGAYINEQNLFYSDFKVNTLVDYKKLFSFARLDQVKGEASVSYLFYPRIAQKIFETIPLCKIIAVLRNPVERGYSHYLMDYKLGLVDLPYEDIVFKRGNHKDLALFYQQYVELGFYAQQLHRYFAVFPKEQIKIYTQDELKMDTTAVVKNLFEFLNVKCTDIVKSELQHNQFSLPKNRLIHKLYSSVWLRKSLSAILPYNFRERVKLVLFKKGKKPELTQKTIEKLLEIYSPDILKLNEMIEQDVLTWMHPNG